jgi:flagellar protein FlaG
MSTEINLQQAFLRDELTLNNRNDLLNRVQPVEKQGTFSQSNNPNVIGEIADTLDIRDEDANKVSEVASKLQKMFETIESDFSLQSRALEFNVVEESGLTVVKVLDKESKDIIRQIPSEEFIRVAEKLSELSEEMKRTRGILFDEKV